MYVCLKTCISLDMIGYVAYKCIQNQIKGPDNPTCVALCVRKTRVEEKEGEKKEGKDL